jgi:hypothetical protein
VCVRACAVRECSCRACVRLRLCAPGPDSVCVSCARARLLACVFCACRPPHQMMTAAGLPWHTRRHCALRAVVERR